MQSKKIDILKKMKTITRNRYRTDARESQILHAALQLLRIHPKIAFAWRANAASGNIVRKNGTEYWLTSNFRGCPDILGITIDGRFLGIETKRAGGSIRVEQQQFIDLINRNGGIGCITQSVEDVLAIIDTNYLSGLQSGGLSPLSEEDKLKATG